MAIPIKAVMNSVGSGETPDYHMFVKNPRHVPENELLRRLSEKSGFDASKGRYWMDNFQCTLFEAPASSST